MFTRRHGHKGNSLSCQSVTIVGILFVLIISCALCVAATSSFPIAKTDKELQHGATNTLPETLTAAISGLYAKASCVVESQKVNSNRLWCLKWDLQRYERTIQTNSIVLSQYHHLTNYVVVLKQNTAISGCEILIMNRRPDTSFIPWLFTGDTNCNVSTKYVGTQHFMFDCNICSDDGTTYLFVFYNELGKAAATFYVQNFERVVEIAKSGEHKHRGMFDNARSQDEMIRSGYYLSNMSELYPDILFRLDDYSRPNIAITRDCRMLWLDEPSIH